MDDPAEHGHVEPPEEPADTAADTAADSAADTAEATAPADEPEQSDPAPAEEASGSSHPAVDEVLRSLERLDDVPVDEHVEAFERAHEELRRALSEARDSGD